MANAWKKYKSNKLTTPKLLFLLTSTSLILLTFFYLSTPTTPPTTFFNPTSPIHPFNCTNTPQPHPIIANQVEGLKHPFIYSLSDFGSLPDKPHKNIVRMLKGKLFRRPDISVTVQDLLDKMRAEGRTGAFVDVGANVGMATFAAAVMGFRVYAFEPVLENLQSVCNGIYFNRVGDLVRLFEAATSDRLGNITFHKLVGRLDNSAVSAAGAKLAFKSNEEVELQVRSVPLDLVIPETERVLLLKIDVQGWEYHVLKGAKKLLSRKKGEAPYLIYEEDERLLQASNSSSTEIRKFLGGLGYTHCVQKGKHSVTDDGKEVAAEDGEEEVASEDGNQQAATDESAGLVEFKELFGSFTGHRVENRSTGMRCGSIGSARNEKWEFGLGATG